MKKRQSVAAKGRKQGAKNQGTKNTSFKAVSKSAKGKHHTQNQAGAKKHFAKKAGAQKKSRFVTNQTTNQMTSKTNARVGKCDASVSCNLNVQAPKEVSAEVLHRDSQPEIERHGVRHLIIDAKFDGQRVDNYIRRLMPNLPKSRLYQMIRKGEVRLNKKRVKTETRVSEGDTLRLPPTTVQTSRGTFVPEKSIAQIKKLVLHKDDNFMVIDKPAGMAVHGGSKNQYGVIDVVRRAFPDEGWELCHRLDKDTSGCLVLGNSREALNTFQDLSIAGEIHKQYLTLVKGSWAANELLVDTPIEKQTSRMNRAGEFEKVYEGGEKQAISIFTTREHYAKTTLMQVVIKTGKTHQIRVHSALNKHPVAMDDKYGDFRWNRALEKLGLPRMFLHSHIIRFRAFDDIIHVSAELPDDLNAFLEASS